MNNTRSLIHPFCAILLTCFVLVGCSGESARYKNQAEQFMAEGHPAEAVLVYRQALKKDPNDPDLLIGLGTALAAQGRDRSAAAALHQAALLKPEDASIEKALAGLIIRPQDGVSLNLAWLFSGMEDEPVGATVSLGKIFVAYAGGHLVTLDQGSGKILWDIDAHVVLSSSPAADDGQVWVGAEDGSIRVYEAGTGREMGSYLTAGTVFASPVLTKDLAFCASNDGSLYALERKTFTLTWKAVIGQALHASPVVGEGKVYVGSMDGRLYGFNASTGERIWLYGILTQGPVESVPTLVNGRVLFGSGDGRIYSLDAETGGEYWHFSTPDAVFARPLVLNDRLILASSGQVLASVGLMDGVQSWSEAFNHPLLKAPAYFKSRLYLAESGDPRLFAVEAQTGKRLGDLNTGDWIADGPLTAGNELILVGKDGAVFLYR
jgi:outer membrane protein assembly factor BamB